MMSYFFHLHKAHGFDIKLIDLPKTKPFKKNNISVCDIEKIVCDIEEFPKGH